MPGVIERLIRHLSQPQYPVGIDRSNPLSAGLTEVYVPLSVTNRTLIRGYNPTVAAGVITSEVGAVGRNIALSNATNNLGLIIAGDGDDIFPSATDATVFVIRRSKDTTARATTLFGYDGSGTGPDRVLAHAPWSDGNIYWDFGSDAAANRISTPYTKSTGIDYLVFIAGGGKGREIWRNGTKIAGDTTKTGSRAATAANFRIGAIPATDARADDEEVYLFGTANRAWSDAEIQSWSKNPWQIFQPLSRKIYVASASGVVEADANSAGTTTTTGVSGATAGSEGASTGIATVSGVAAAVAPCDASSAGVAVVTGDSGAIAGVVANASGVATVDGVSGATAGTVGSASGQATANGVGADGSVVEVVSANTFSQEVEIRKFYMRKGKKLLMFDSVSDAEAYTQAEALVDEAIATKTSRLARKRLRTRIAGSSLPAQTIDTDWLAGMMQRFAINLDLPTLLDEQDFERVMQIHAMAMKMQDDEEDVELLLMWG